MAKKKDNPSRRTNAFLAAKKFVEDFNKGLGFHKAEPYTCGMGQNEELWIEWRHGDIPVSGATATILESSQADRRVIVVKPLYGDEHRVSIRIYVDHGGLCDENEVNKIRTNFKGATPKKVLDWLKEIGAGETAKA